MHKRSKSNTANENQKKRTPLHSSIWTVPCVNNISGRHFSHTTVKTNLNLSHYPSSSPFISPFGCCMHPEIIPHLRPEILAAIEDHQNQAHRVILISGSFAPLLDQLTLNLDVEAAIATPLAIEHGHYTRKIVPPLNIGQVKVNRVKHFLHSPWKEIDLSKSFFSPIRRSMRQS